MLCYSFISHCCPLVLIIVGSFKFEIGMLQKQSCPFCVLPLFLWDFAHGGKGAYACLKSFCQFPSPFIHLCICMSSHIFVTDEQFLCVC